MNYEVTPPPREGDRNGTRWVLIDGVLHKERRQDQEPFREALAVVALGLLVVVASLSVYGAFQRSIDSERQSQQAERIAFEVRDLSREGCRRNNDVRQAVRGELRASNQLTRRLRPHQFPGLTAAEFAAFVEERIADRRRAIRDLRQIDCVAEYETGEDADEP